jgi:hypothetical protein
LSSSSSSSSTAVKTDAHSDRARLRALAVSSAPANVGMSTDVPALPVYAHSGSILRLVRLLSAKLSPMNQPPRSPQAINSIYDRLLNYESANPKPKPKPADTDLVVSSETRTRLTTYSYLLRYVHATRVFGIVFLESLDDVSIH